jgi:aromatic ring-opening dioxygenase catalytic subunit (LigB family)
MLPTLYLSHGGGPWPWLPKEMPSFAELGRFLKELPATLPERPQAILMVSAHWEEKEFALMAHSEPPMIYDYSGFPPHTYTIEYRAPGDPALARKAHALLEQAGVPSHLDFIRGFDHGVYALLFPIYPKADVPIVQLSMKKGYDPKTHLEVGRILAPLRQEGILILGSGNSFHNFHPPADVKERSLAFDRWLTDTLVKASGEERADRLIRWEEAPAARIAQPREDHLLPLMVAVGAAFEDKGERIYHELTMGTMANSSFRFG